MPFLGPNGLFVGLGSGSKTVSGFKHVVAKSLVSMIPSILAFDFDLMLRSLLSFWKPNWLFLGVSSCRLVTFVFRVLLYFCSFI